MSLTPECLGRLENWKFERAADFLDREATDEERNLVTALAIVFGDSGWFPGEMEVIVSAAVSTLLEEE